MIKRKPHDPSSMPLKEIEKELERLEEEGLEWELGFNVINLLKSLDKQKRLNELFKNRLNEGNYSDIDELGSFSWNDVLQDYRNEVLTTSPETNKFYNNCVKMALKQFDSVTTEFKKVNQLYKDAYEDQMRRSEDERRRNNEKSLANYYSSHPEETDWGAVEGKHIKVSEGFVYILTNPLLTTTVKIGFTTQSPIRRAQEVTKSFGLPQEFDVYYFTRVRSPYIIEQMIHQELSDCGKGRELYEVSASKAKDILIDIITKQDAEITE